MAAAVATVPIATVRTLLGRAEALSLGEAGGDDHPDRQAADRPVSRQPASACRRGGGQEPQRRGRQGTPSAARSCRRLPRGLVACPWTAEAPGALSGTLDHGRRWNGGSACAAGAHGSRPGWGWRKRGGGTTHHKVEAAPMAAATRAVVPRGAVSGEGPAACGRARGATHRGGRAAAARAPGRPPLGQHHYQHRRTRRWPQGRDPPVACAGLGAPPHVLPEPRGPCVPFQCSSSGLDISRSLALRWQSIARASRPPARRVSCYRRPTPYASATTPSGWCLFRSVLGRDGPWRPVLADGQ